MKTKITYNDNYYADQNGNKWNALIFTRKDAVRLSKSMQNCTDCIDCGNCTNCHGCSWCFDCHDLVNKFTCLAESELRNMLQIQSTCKAHNVGHAITHNSFHRNEYGDVRYKPTKYPTLSGLIGDGCLLSRQAFKAGLQMTPRRFCIHLGGHSMYHISELIINSYGKHLPGLVKRMRRINALVHGANTYSKLWNRLARRREEWLQELKGSGRQTFEIMVQFDNKARLAEILERFAAATRAEADEFYRDTAAVREFEEWRKARMTECLLNIRGEIREELK